MATVQTGLTQVQNVLAKGPIPDPIATLEEARNDPGRREKIQAIRKEINEKGIKYIFFQQISVSGHVNGKGVSATQWEKVAEDGYQLVYGATADLFVVRRNPSSPPSPTATPSVSSHGIPAWRASSAIATTPRPANSSKPTRARI
jgi:glutamine synthetase